MSVLQDGKIQGKDVYLRPITVDDTDDIIRWRNSDSVRPYFIYQKPFTREGHLNWLRTMIDTGKGYQFIVCENETDRPIGCTYVRDYDKEHNKIEYGMFLGEKTETGKGISAQIVRMTLDYCFEDLKIHKVFCRIFADNIPSIKGCERGGFRREAYLEDEVFVDGRYRDMVLLAAINPRRDRG